MPQQEPEQRLLLQRPQQQHTRSSLYLQELRELLFYSPGCGCCCSCAVPPQQQQRRRHVCAEDRVILVTGAGLSAACGLPLYRKGNSGSGSSGTPLSPRRRRRRQGTAQRQHQQQRGRQQTLKLEKRQQQQQQPEEQAKLQLQQENGEQQQEQERPPKREQERLEAEAQRRCVLRKQQPLPVDQRHECGQQMLQQNWHEETQQGPVAQKQHQQLSDLLREVDEQHTKGRCRQTPGKRTTKTAGNVYRRCSSTVDRRNSAATSGNGCFIAVSNSSSKDARDNSTCSSADRGGESSNSSNNGERVILGSLSPCRSSHMLCGQAEDDTPAAAPEFRQEAARTAENSADIADAAAAAGSRSALRSAAADVKGGGATATAASTGGAATAATEGKQPRVVWDEEPASSSDSSNTGRKKRRCIRRRRSHGEAAAARRKTCRAGVFAAAASSSVATAPRPPACSPVTKACPPTNAGGRATPAGAGFAAAAGAAAAAGVAEWWGQVSTFASLRERWYTDFWFRLHDPRSARCCFFSLGHAVLALLLLLRPHSTLLLTQNVDRLHHAAAIFLAPRLTAATYRAVFACMRAAAALVPKPRETGRLPAVAAVGPTRTAEEVARAADTTSLAHATTSSTLSPKSTPGGTRASVFEPVSAAATPAIKESTSAAAADGSRPACGTCASESLSAAAAAASAVKEALSTAAAADGGSLACGTPHSAARGDNPTGTAAASGGSAAGETAGTNPAVRTGGFNVSAVPPLAVASSSFHTGGAAASAATSSCAQLEEEEKSSTTQLAAIGSVPVSAPSSSGNGARCADNIVTTFAANAAAAFREELTETAEQATAALIRPAAAMAPSGDGAALATCTAPFVGNGSGAAEEASSATAAIYKPVNISEPPALVCGSAPAGLPSEATAAGRSSAKRGASAARAAVARAWLAPCGGWWGLGKPLQQQQAEEQQPQVQYLHYWTKRAQEGRPQQECCREAHELQHLQRPELQQKGENESGRVCEQFFEQSLPRVAAAEQMLEQQRASEHYCTSSRITSTRFQQQLSPVDMKRISAMRTKGKSFVRCQDKDKRYTLHEAADAAVAASQRSLLLPPMGRMFELHGCMYSYRCSGVFSASAATEVLPQAQFRKAPNSSCRRCSSSNSSRIRRFSKNVREIAGSSSRTSSRSGTSRKTSDSASSRDIFSIPLGSSTSSGCSRTKNCEPAELEKTPEQQQEAWLADQRTACPYRYNVALDESEVIWCPYQPPPGTEEGYFSFDAAGEQEERNIELENTANKQEKMCDPLFFPPSASAKGERSAYGRGILPDNHLSNAQGALLRVANPASTAVAVVSPPPRVAPAAPFSGDAAAAECKEGAPGTDAAAAAAAAVTATTTKPTSLAADAVGHVVPAATSAVLAAVAAGPLAAAEGTTAAAAAVISPSVESCAVPPSVSAGTHRKDAAAGRCCAAASDDRPAAAGATGPLCVHVGFCSSYCSTCSRATVEAAESFAGVERRLHSTWAGRDVAAGAEAPGHTNTLHAAADAAVVGRDLLAKDLQNTGLQVLQQTAAVLQKQLMSSSTVFLPVCPYCYSMCLPLCLWFDEFLFSSHRAFQSSEAFRAAFLFAGLFPISSVPAATALCTVDTLSIPGAPAETASASLTAPTPASRHSGDAAQAVDTLLSEHSTVAGDGCRPPEADAAVRCSQSAATQRTLYGIPNVDAAFPNVCPAEGPPAAVQGCTAICAVPISDEVEHVVSAGPAAISKKRRVSLGAQHDHLLCSDKCCSSSAHESKQRSQQGRVRCSWLFIGTSFSTASTDWLLLLRQETSYWSTRAARGGRRSCEEQRVYNINYSTCVDACFEATEQQQMLLQARLRDAALFYDRLAHAVSSRQEDKAYTSQLKRSQKTQQQQKSIITCSSGVKPSCCTSAGTSLQSTLQSQACASLGRECGKASTTRDMLDREGELCPQWLEELPAHFSTASDLTSKSVLNVYRCNTMRRIVGDAQEILLLLCPPEVREWITRAYGEWLCLFNSSIAREYRSSEISSKEMFQSLPDSR